MQKSVVRIADYDTDAADAGPAVVAMT